LITQTLDLKEISFQQGFLSLEKNYLFGIKATGIEVNQYGGILTWNILRNPFLLIVFVIYFIASLAEANRAPFDLAEAESELTAGFHTEYSGMKFALFFLAEYINVFIVCAIGATLFLGGWMPFHIGHWQTFNHVMDFIPSSIWFFGKTFFLIFLIMWFRWTFPRLRIDQLLDLEWKYLLPISMFNILLITLMAILGWHF
jgi:NADH-quinone oxidoreductase subunit H